MTVTAQEVMEDLRDIVRQVPEDFIYDNGRSDAEDCLYVHYTPDNSLVPGCIVAHVLVRHGVSLDALTGYEGTTARVVLKRISFRGICMFEEDAQHILANAQAIQDQGDTWHFVLEQSESFYDKLVSQAATPEGSTS